MSGDLSMRVITLTPYIHCRAAMRRLTLLCTYSPLVAIAAAASALHAVDGEAQLAVLFSLVFALPYAVILNTFVMQAVLTRRSFNWLFALSGIGVAHTLSLTVLMLTSAQSKATVAHDAVAIAAWIFSPMFVCLVIFCLVRVWRCRRGVEIAPGVDFNSILRRIKRCST